MINQNILYKSIDSLKEDLKKSKDENAINWLKWFNSTKYKLSSPLKKNEYLFPYYKDLNMYSLQLWKKNSKYNEVDYNLISNYISEYNNGNTKYSK